MRSFKLDFDECLTCGEIYTVGSEHICGSKNKITGMYMETCFMCGLDFIKRTEHDKCPKCSLSPLIGKLAFIMENDEIKEPEIWCVCDFCSGVFQGKEQFAFTFCKKCESEWKKKPYFFTNSPKKTLNF